MSCAYVIVLCEVDHRQKGPELDDGEQAEIPKLSMSLKSQNRRQGPRAIISDGKAEEPDSSPCTCKSSSVDWNTVSVILV